MPPRLRALVAHVDAGNRHKVSMTQKSIATHLSWIAAPVFFYFSFLSATCCAAGPKDFYYRFNLWNEATNTGVNRSSIFNPENLWLNMSAWSNSLVAEGEASFSLMQRFKIAGGFVNRYDYSTGNHDRLRMKELYLKWSVNSHWDATVGKKILKWGTGYAWTPSGVLDPQRDPRDPADRLSQYEGRELVELRGTYGYHSFTAVYSSPHLFSKLQTRRREDQWAVKYNALVRKLDYSLIASFGGLQAANRYGGNATYVVGQSLELHGEYIAQRGSHLLYPLAIAQEDPRVTFNFPPYASLKERDGRIYPKILAGANYTFPSGWNLIVEYYHDQQGLNATERRRLDSFALYNEEQDRILAGSDLSNITLPAANLLWTLQGLGGFNRSRDYLFVRLARDRIANRLNLETIALFSLFDGSSVWIPHVSFDFNQRIGAYARFTYYAGEKISEFGSLPWRWASNLGIALRF
jgi:hypothetical protein